LCGPAEDGIAYAAAREDMKPLRRALLVSLLGLLRVERVHAWGNEGHQTIGAMADRLLQGKNAAKHVRELLDGGTLERYAIWADCAKHYCADWYDDEMVRFAAANPDHHHYHYTDIPMQEEHYADGSVGADPDDVVHVLRQCIDVLAGTDTPQTNPHGFSPKIALILAAHLVGDIHQPLHVGAAYVDPNEQYVDPNRKWASYVDTKGGNFLRLDGKTNLHAYWDVDAVSQAMAKAGAKDAGSYAAAILKRPAPARETERDARTWPLRWADEALPIAAQSYQPVHLGPRYFKSDRRGEHPQWDVLPESPSFRERIRDVADTQLAKAGYRLAVLLEWIWP